MTAALNEAAVGRVELERRIEDRTKALRDSEGRHAFLLRLSDALRLIEQPADIADVAARQLGDQLEASRVCYIEMSGNRLNIKRNYTRGTSSVIGDYELDAFDPAFLANYQPGEVVTVCDVGADERLGGDARAELRARNVAAFADVVLFGDARQTSILAVQHTTPRVWTDAEQALIRNVGDRVRSAIERARAEAALRESEARFAQFAAASAAGLWIRDASSLTMEYSSPATDAIYGVKPRSLLGDVRLWGSTIIPEDRKGALEHLEQARRGEPVVHEFLIQRASDCAFRWIRNTDFPLYDELGRVQRIGGIAEDVTEAKLAAEHTSVLLAELQHRVRNIMAMIRSITARTGERAESVPEYTGVMMGRLLALARVQALLTRAANVSVSIASIVQEEVSAQAQHEGQFDLGGPDLALSPKAAEVLTLAIHELATNALKYGALSIPEGRVTVRWATFEKRGAPWLGFDWSEDGAPERPATNGSTPRRRGFGTELIEGRIPYELGGRGEVVIETSGARCHLEFPLRESASILETDAPRRATVFGGALDMVDQADLSGHRILVVEDDYYLATDAARAIRGTGAEVLGPCPTEDRARDELEAATPTGAILDINTGQGASFALAAELRQRGVPFVFVTGYDMTVIPREFDGVERLQKPVDLRQIVGALAKALGVAA